jgi:hypothetical protein
MHGSNPGISNKCLVHYHWATSMRLAFFLLRNQLVPVWITVQAVGGRGGLHLKGGGGQKIEHKNRRRTSR